MPSRLFVDLSLLRTNANFRRILIARTISLMGLGMLAVSVPLQIYDLTGSSFQVGIAAALDGAGMFAGLLLGGVLADLHDRRRLILMARSICGLGFLALALNSMLPVPSVVAIYVLATWDGFFGALGVSALMAAMPHIVGRENLMQASALGMMTARFATIVSPALGGVVIALAGVGWNYILAAVATLVTVLTLLHLPSMVPPRGEPEHPLRMLGQAFAFVFRRPALLALFTIGGLMTLTSAIRILFPALASGPFGGGAFETGLLFSAVPVGATLGAVLSGWARHVAHPDSAMTLLCMLAFACIAAFGLCTNLYLGMALLVIYGYATALASIVQYALVQSHTPDAYLGRVNSLWAAMDNLGDIAGALLIGLTANIFMPAESVLALGMTALAIAMVLGAVLRMLRRSDAQDDLEPAKS
ncbi:enterobactin transporter EntS [Rhizobium sp. FKL33]|uniref:enterobactin transporter EntS n=1 Tax=Rhizobium sp. FKL33 TaxID=2562307 RepID=UPI0010C11433|nr:enterobactin transporter EntS [Rhizobium sp. FKL33]